MIKGLKIIYITPGVADILKRLQGGETLTVTYGNPNTYTLSGAGSKSRQDILASAFNGLKEFGLLEETEPGLFKGCGQSFVVVR